MARFRVRIRARPRDEVSRLLVALLLGVVLALPSGTLAAAAGAADYWPQFQGSADHRGTGVSGDVPPPLEMAWRFRTDGPELGRTVAPPVIADGLAIGLTRESVFALDLATGEKRWQLSRKSARPAAPAVAVVGNRAVLLFTEGSKEDSRLVAYDLIQGTMLWAQALDRTSTSGVAVEGGVAFVADRSGEVYAVDVAAEASKRILWRFEGAGEVDAPPAVAGGKVFVMERNAGTGEVRLVALDAASGKEQWEFSPSVPVGAGSAPTVAGGMVFFGTSDLFARSLDAATGSELWASRVRSFFYPFTGGAFAGGDFLAAATTLGESGLYRLDGSSGRRVWEGGAFEFDTPNIRSSPVVSGQTVYVGLEDGRIAALDLASGDLVWEGDTGDGALGGLALGGSLLVVSKDGDEAGIVAFRHDPGGRLVRVESLTKFDPARTLVNYALSLAAVGGVFVVGGWAVTRIRRRRAAPEGEDE